ncbi:MAG: PH domain-containing protein [Verrucomicrobiota bacterium]
MSPVFAPLLTLIWLITLLYTVRGYRLEKGQLFVHRLLWETPVPLDGLQSAQVINSNVIKGSLRLFGNGGLFAFCGWFWNRELGRYRMWVTDTKRLVLIRCGERTLVVSPDDPQEFVRVLTESVIRNA